MFKKISLSAALLLNIVACGNTPTTSVSSTPVLSDEQIFRGSFFLQGDFGSSIASSFGPQLAADFSGMRAERGNDYDKFVDRMIGQIQKSDPQFISNFASHVRSRDYTGVQNDIRLSEGILMKAIETSYNIPHEKFVKAVSAAREMVGKVESSSTTPTGVGTLSTFYKATDAAVAAYLVVNVAGVITQVSAAWGYSFAVYVVAVVIGKTPSGPGGSELKEQIEASAFINKYAEYASHN